MNQSSLALKVGILVISAITTIGILSFLISRGPSFIGGSKTYWFEVEDAYGLITGSPINVSGIPVGVIEKIVLIRNKARLFIKIKKDIFVTSSSFIKIRPTGILGDKNITLFLGNPEDQPLKNREQIHQVLTNSDMANIAELLSESILVIKEVAHSFKKTFEMQNLNEESTVIEKILYETKDILENLSTLSENNINKIARIVDNLNSIAERFNEFIQEGGVENLEISLRNLSSVTEKISEGEGSLGKLISDDTTVIQLNQVVTNLNDYLGNISKIETSFDFHTEYLERLKTFKSFFGLKIKPGLDRHYELSLIDDSKGVFRETLTRTSDLDSKNTTTEKEEKFHKNQLKVSALFVKNIYNLSLKMGMIENSAGFGFDVHLLDKRFKFSTELFNISQFEMRTFLKFNIFQGFYLIGGGNSLFSKNNEASPFFGAGLFMTNKDIKTLISKIPF